MSVQLSHHPKGGAAQFAKCFVVMPFGVKPMKDGSSRTYDFDKVYRVIIQRAIRQAGMQPIRADERVGSSIIHTDMFKDLRDEAVVLADLSLDNPNVFYELGVRHVMTRSGTVLMCRKGADLPFDVHLSRVIFYEYDGQSLDWEEVERVVAQLQIALQQARRGEPDSPVHALLETVFREEIGLSRKRPGLLPAARLAPTKYQQLIAGYWKRGNEELEKLYAEHRDMVFGLRAMGYYCLEENPLPEQAVPIARHMVDAEQYELANRLFEGLRIEGKLDYVSLLDYASSYREEYTDLNGVNRAIAFAGEAA